MNRNKDNIERSEVWEKIKIKDVCSQIFSGGTPKTSKKEYWNGFFPWLSSGVTGNRFIIEAKNYITDLGVKNSSTRLAKAGSSIVASAGQGHTRGQVSYLLIDAYINQSLIVLFPIERKLDSKFLFYTLDTKYKRFRQISDDHSIRGSLTTKLLGEEFILLPSLQEQKAIAKIPFDLDSKIEHNKKMNRTLETIAQAIFMHWFIDFEFPNEEGKPYKSSEGEMVDSELGEIPKGWEVTNLGYQINFKKGKKPVEINSNEDPNLTPIISMEMLEGGRPNLGNPLGMNIANKYDPVMVMDGASSGRVEIGFEGIIGSTFASVTSTGYEVSKFYLYHTLKSVEREIRNNPTGTSIPHTDKSKINKMKILIPDKRVLHLFDDFIRVSIDTLVRNRKEIIILDEIKNLLLPRLITGKIRVPLEVK